MAILWPVVCMLKLMVVRRCVYDARETAAEESTKSGDEKTLVDFEAYQAV